MNKNVFIATSSFATFSNAPLQLLDSNGINYEMNNSGRKLMPQEIKKKLSKYSGVIAGTELYNRKTLTSLPDLKVISRLGVGMDNIDSDYAIDNGIKIFKTKTSPALAVSELTIGLILNLFRKINYQNNQLKNGIWEKNMGELLSGKTIGIIGLGTIGKQLVNLLLGFNLKILANDLHKDREFIKNKNIKYCSLEYLLANSEIISIHLNLTQLTNGLFNYKLFKKMRRTPILINASRGEIIDEKSLIRALDEKLIKGVGLDVFVNEPYSGKLINYNNAILTPHIGSYAKEIRMKMELEAVQNLIEGFDYE
jgi:D-3-phosphoglycerate dehydrogenase / 2-oxoglutarate reductase